jgi:hypothetical protein
MFLYHLLKITRHRHGHRMGFKHQNYALMVRGGGTVSLKFYRGEVYLLTRGMMDRFVKIITRYKKIQNSH